MPLADITISRGYGFLLSILKWKIYANSKMVAKVGNGSTASFSLPEGAYEIIINCPDFPVPFRRKGLHSNVLHLKAEAGKKYHFGVGTHPLFWWGKHHPGLGHLFTPVECLLLQKQDARFQDNRNHLEHIGKQIKAEIKHFTYHPFSLILIIAVSLFAMVSNIRHPDLYATGDGTAWGFLFGVTNLVGLFMGGMNKQMMAGGWEYKLLFYTASASLMILFFIPRGYPWQSNLYLFSVLATCFWAYFCFKRWKENKKGLDKIEEQEMVFERRL